MNGSTRKIARGKRCGSRRLPSLFGPLSLPARLAVWIFLPSGLMFISACHSQNSENAAAMPKETVPVTAAEAVQKDVPIELNVVGHVEAYSTVTVKSRVGGELTQVYFEEGQSVKKDAPLFQIDPRPFQAMMGQAEAKLEKDKALLKNAEDDFQRYADLVKKDYVTQEQYHQIQTDFEALKATVKADEAEVENARLQVGYCSIQAPISGRTGSLLVHRGNQIKANDDTGMVVIHQIRPVYVRFAAPEQYLAEIRKNMAAGKLPVEVTVSGFERPVSGELDFIDNAVDSTTGTIELKAVFPNEDEALWTGQFVNVSLRLSMVPHATVVPSQAIQISQAGSYVFVVKPDKTVEYRIVKTGIIYNGETVIEEGVAPGDSVVTDGQLRLVPGSEVSMTRAGEGE